MRVFRLLVFARFPGLALGLALANRAQWLNGGPFGDRLPIPGWCVAMFGAGAVLTLVGWLLSPWWSTGPMLGAFSAIGCYGVWVIWTTDVLGVEAVRGTVVDLALIPILVAWTYSRDSLQLPDGGDPEEASA